MAIGPPDLDTLARILRARAWPEGFEWNSLSRALSTMELIGHLWPARFRMSATYLGRDKTPVTVRLTDPWWCAPLFGLDIKTFDLILFEFTRETGQEINDEIGEPQWHVFPDGVADAIERYLRSVRGSASRRGSTGR